MALQPDTVEDPPLAMVRLVTKPPFHALVATVQLRLPGFGCVVAELVVELDVVELVVAAVVPPVVLVVVVVLGGVVALVVVTEQRPFETARPLPAPAVPVTIEGTQLASSRL